MPQNDVTITIGADDAQLGAGLNKAQSQVSSFAEKVDRAGRQGMIGLRSVSEAADALGATGFSSAVRGAAGFADTIGDMVGAIGELTPTMAILGAAAIGISVAISQWNEASKRNTEYVQAQVKPYADLYEQIKKVNAEKKLEAQMGFNQGQLVDLAKSGKVQGENAEIFTQRQKDLAEARARVALWNKFQNDSSMASKWDSGVQGITDMWKGAETLEQTYAKITAIEASIASDQSLITKEIAESTEQANRLAAALQKANSGAFMDARDLRNSDATKKAAQDAMSVDAQLATEGWRKIAAAQDKFTESLTTLKEKQADVGASLSRNLANLARDYNRQVASFAKEETRIYADEAKVRTQVERDSQKELANIEKERSKSLAQVNRDEAKSLADVDRQLASTLRTSRSARDRREARRAAAERKAEIVQQAAERRAEINAQAEERKQAALEQKAERLQQIAEQRQERLAELAEKKKLAQEEYAFRKAEAKRAADEQIAAARQTAQKAYNELDVAMQNQNRLVGSSVAKLGNDLSVQARGLGLAISNGIAAGVAAGQAGVTNAVLGVAKAALGTAKASLGIKSPSRVFAEQVGRPMAQGIAQGFKNQVGAQTFALSFNHSWNGNASAVDRTELARIAQEAAYNGVHIALRGGANG